MFYKYFPTLSSTRLLPSRMILTEPVIELKPAEAIRDSDLDRKFMITLYRLCKSLPCRVCNPCTFGLGMVIYPNLTSLRFPMIVRFPCE